MANEIKNEKLTKKDFLVGINYLKNYYLNNDFEINNELFLDVWYNTFSSLTKEKYFGIIKMYCAFEETTPKNPNSLLKYLRGKSGIEVWEWAKMINDQYPYDNAFYRNKFFQVITEDTLAYKILKEMIDNSEENIFNEEKNVADVFKAHRNGVFIVADYLYRKNHFVKNYDSLKRLENEKKFLGGNKEKKMLCEKNN